MENIFKKPTQHSVTNNLQSLKSLNCELSTVLLSCDYSYLQSTKHANHTAHVCLKLQFVWGIYIYIFMHIYISVFICILTFSKMVLQCLVLSLIKSKEPLDIPISECRKAIYTRIKEKESPSMHLFHFILSHPLLFTIYKKKSDIKGLYRFKG